MPADPLTTLRTASARAKNREGIPMVVALVDERRPMWVAADPAVRADGIALAGRIRDVRNALGPSMAEADNGGVITALVIAAHDLTDPTDPDGGDR